MKKLASASDSLSRTQHQKYPDQAVESRRGFHLDGIHHLRSKWQDTETCLQISNGKKIATSENNVEL